ncbi:vitamin K epoxide reductase family protein [Nocardioides mesophilus]|uniref:Vitamin K epoxide reductase domain-containing protein n=1 Tax=Nocardioides mesophilus TaxID=433659 RepID=A0A7G9R6U5_9ACTN|nr:vitamin K epoxide reductase family protein [Nocardioides mesophilus]QNN51320.1 hypothetical protein H9L09_11875 [Nocardioides mesophilus]
MATGTTPVRTHDAAASERVRPAARGWWLLVLGAALLGIVGTIWQTVERIAFESGSQGPSFCEISSVVSCSSVYAHWQSSALGVPNSLVGLPVFAILASGAASALLGSRLSRGYLRLVLGLALFMTGFATWYMQQTAFDIGSLCVFCAASLALIMLAGLGLVRIAAAEAALGSGRTGRTVAGLVDAGLDIALWVALGLGVATMLVLGLG